MKGIYAAVGVFSTLAYQCHANLDVITLNTKSDTWIQEASATLVTGDVPQQITGDSALWSAIMMENQASFLQGVTENAPPGGGYCTNLGRNWCNFAYTLVGNNPTVGKAVSAPPGSRIKTHYKLNANTQMWDQNLYVNDTLVSNVSTSKGQHGKIFYVSLECAAGTCASVPAHKWEDISIVLNKADQSFGHTGKWQYSATGGEMSTSDSGKTWNFTTLNIPATVPR